MNAKRLFGLLLTGLLGSTATPTHAAATNEVATAKYDWLDSKRDRPVPVKIYYPKNGAVPFPVIIFSHGLGGTRDGYEYLGRHWASHGYVSVHLQHIGSDAAVWKSAASNEVMPALRRAVANPQHAIDRPLDVSFAIDQLTRMNREDTPLKGRLDLERIGAAGHSFGAYTTLAVAGQVFVGTLVDGKTLGDPRIKAAIPMSPTVPREKGRLDKAFGALRIPCLHMTGTKDTSPVTDTKAEERRLPYDHIHGADQYLIIFNDGDHMIFSDHKRPRGGGEKDPLFHDLICKTSTAFWDAYLKGDAKAKGWLTEGGLEKELGKDGTFERKRKLPRQAS